MKNSEKTHCMRGHPLSGKNLKMTSRGSRNCRTCHAMYTKKYKDQKREAASK